MKPNAIPSLSIASLLLASVVLVLAAPCAAQTRKTPEQELAAVIVVEEQQGDLAKAEALYRRAVGDASLSPAAQQLARQRLARLLQRLGREAQDLPVVATAEGVAAAEVPPGKPEQDPERIAEMRRKAGELLDSRVGKKLDDAELRGLEWLGEPIVPEILARPMGEPHIALLWRIGGQQASEYLRKAARDPDTQPWIASKACQLHRPEMMKVAEEFLAHPNFAVVTALLLNCDAGLHLLARVSVDALLSMAERGDAQRRAFVIEKLGNRIASPEEANRMVALLRHAFASTDPGLGAAAQQALTAPYLHRCVAGLELLAGQNEFRPIMVAQPVRWPLDAYSAENQLLPGVAVRLWSAMLSCANRHRPGTMHANWVCGWLVLLATEGEVGKVNDLLPLAGAGHNVWDGVAARMQPGDIKPVLETIRSLPEDGRRVPVSVLRSCLRLGVPAHAIIQLLALAPSPKQYLDGRRRDQQDSVLWMDLLASTGHSAAWEILLATTQLCDAENFGSFAPVSGLLRLAQTQPGEERRAALRGIAVGRRLSSVLLALLNFGDEAALDLLKGNESAAEHPLAADGEGKKYTPIGYLFSASAEPPAHRYSEAQLTKLLQRLREDGSGFGTSGLSPQELAADTSDEHVRLLAAQVPNSYSTGTSTTVTWSDIALERARSQDGKNGWAAWLEEALGHPAQNYHLLRNMTEAELQGRIPQLRRWAEGGPFALSAHQALMRIGQPIDILAAFSSKEDAVRDWAFHRVVDGEAVAPIEAMLPFLAVKQEFTRLTAVRYFSEKLSIEAVPGLIALLRDPKSKIREAAEQALTRIRFYHEQQAHWDRVLRGLDASPASAMEKLLLQARPEAAKAQRLLAIPSLGSLGKAEALPFLIDWSNEGDAEIAAAAKAAITKIHLEPRR